MNLSMERALEESTDTNKDLGDLGFILTVLRDNTSDDYVHQVLDNLINNNHSPKKYGK
ncbi:hypothetical protein [Psychrobacillus sp. L3]|uniref:hypothetical protein n=1 Tax=Psychrobacillus sp. L3 TaxID=3236891 RepID=UPI0036F27ED1